MVRRSDALDALDATSFEFYDQANGSRPFWTHVACMAVAGISLGLRTATQFIQHDPCTVPEAPMIETRACTSQLGRTGIAGGALVLPVRVCVGWVAERREFDPRIKRKTSGHRPSRRDVARARAPRCGTYPLITRLQRLK